MVVTVLAGAVANADDTRPAVSGNTTPDSASAAIARAEHAMSAARDAGNVWLETPSLVRRARDAHAGGHYARAIELADRAQIQAGAALNQALVGRARYFLRTRDDIDPVTRKAVIGLLRINAGAEAVAVFGRQGYRP